MTRGAPPIAGDSPDLAEAPAPLAVLLALPAGRDAPPALAASGADWAPRRVDTQDAAYRALGADPFDLVLIAETLPDGDAGPFCATLHGHPLYAHVPVAVWCAAACDPHPLLAAGALEVLGPGAPDLDVALLRLARAALRHRALRRQNEQLQRFLTGEQQLLARVQQQSVRLEKANLRLEELALQKDQFLGMAAHDLRNPLTTVRLFCELLLGGELGALPGEAHDAVATIDRQSDEMLALLADLLDINKIEAGKVTLHPVRLALAPLLAEQARLHDLLARKKGITVAAALPAPLPEVWADPARVGEIVKNLLSNAIKYSASAARVTLAVRATDDGRAVRVDVADTGQGIPAHELDLLFTSFARISVRPTGGESSHGLGLAIVKKLVEAQGGRVWAASTRGAGSTFSFTLPRADQSDVPRAQAPGAAGGVPARAPTASA